MNKLMATICMLLLYSSCKIVNVPRDINTISIQEFKMDSMSIRAIKVIDKNKIIYASSTGEVGFFSIDGTSKSIFNQKYNDSIIPNFRSIASNKKGIFALSIGNPALLYKISDDKSKLVYKEKHEKVFYDALQFFDNGTNGIAVGDPTEDCPSIIITKDGGFNWKKISCDELPQFEEGEAFFAASNTNIKTIGNTVWIASGGKKARILKSNDYGKNWEIYNTPIIQGDGPQGIYSIDFADENNGIVIGGNYAKPLENTANKAITKDGGKTWTLVANGKNPNYKSCVQYVPNTQGKEVFAVGKTGVSFSNDGGITWREVSKDSYYTLQFVDKNTAWLSGNNKIGKLDLN